MPLSVNYTPKVYIITTKFYVWAAHLGQEIGRSGKKEADTTLCAISTHCWFYRPQLKTPLCVEWLLETDIPPAVMIVVLQIHTLKTTSAEWLLETDRPRRLLCHSLESYCHGSQNIRQPVVEYKTANSLPVLSWKPSVLQGFIKLKKAEISGCLIRILCQRTGTSASLILK